jgi:hypothetical protein
VNGGTASEEAQRLRLIRIVQAAGLPVYDVLRLARGYSDCLANLSDATCLAYACALLATAKRRGGCQPDGWGQASTCARCGAVWLWHGAPTHVLGCPWCFNRAAGRPIPRPRVQP